MKELELTDIEDAKRRINAHVHETPVFTSSLLNKWLGHNVVFKAECLQKIGAFKARGGCNTVSWLIEQGARPERIIANSSGNHAQAVAWASSLFGIPSTIYMPKNVSTVKAQATASYGAQVELCETRVIVDQLVAEASRQKGTYWIPPYNHEQVICGQGTAAYEAIKQVGDVDAVFAPCGGGGLLSGTLISTRALAPKAEVIGVEPLQANDAAESLRTGSICKLEGTPDTLADGARTLSVGELTFEYLKQLDEFYEVDEPEIVYWTQWLNHLLKLRIEPTSAMPMAAVCKWLAKQTSSKTVLVILSGGNMDQNMTNAIWETDCMSHTPGL